MDTSSATPSSKSDVTEGRKSTAVYFDKLAEGNSGKILYAKEIVLAGLLSEFQEAITKAAQPFITVRREQAPKVPEAEIWRQVIEPVVMKAMTDHRPASDAQAEHPPELSGLYKETVEIKGRFAREINEPARRLARTDARRDTGALLPPKDALEFLAAAAHNALYNEKERAERQDTLLHRH